MTKYSVLDSQPSTLHLLSILLKTMPRERYNYHFHFTDEETNVTDCGNLFSPTARQRQSQGWNPTAPDCKVYPLCFYSSSVCKYHILVAGVYFDTFLVFKFFKNLEKRKKKTHTTFSIRKYRCFFYHFDIFSSSFSMSYLEE